MINIQGFVPVADSQQYAHQKLEIIIFLELAEHPH